MSFRDFLSFVEFHGLSLLNKKFQFGVPTYVKPEAKGNSTSIIDFGVTDSPDFVVDFLVRPEVFGTSAHSSHRILECLLDAGRPQVSHPANLQSCTFTRPQYHRLCADNVERYKESAVKCLVPLLPRLEALLDRVKAQSDTLAPDFTLTSFTKILNGVKSDSLGIRKKGGQKAGKKLKATRAIRRLQTKLDRVSAELIAETALDKRTELLDKVRTLEVKKREALERKKEKQYEYFLSELEQLDMSNRSTAFWAEVNSTLGKKDGKNSIGVIKNKHGETRKQPF